MHSSVVHYVTKAVSICVLYDWAAGVAEERAADWSSVEGVEPTLIAGLIFLVADKLALILVDLDR